MVLINSLISPISIAFTITIIGYYIGKIKIFKVSLNLSAVLIVAVFFGMLLMKIPALQMQIDITEYNANMKFFSDFGTALFVSSIGISAGCILDFRNYQEIKATLIGSLMVISSFVTMGLIAIMDSGISASKLLGCVCGALTTTPGLSASYELKNIISQEVTLGYSSCYLLGVLATVLFVQMTTRKINSMAIDAKTLKNNFGSRVALNGFIQIAATVVLGRVIGCLEVLGFSLGDSGGMLCAGVIIGYFLKTHFQKSLASTKQLSTFKNVGLVLFFVGNGLPSGMKFGGGFELKLLLYGAIMTIIPIALGVLLYKLFFKEGTIATVIAGGMTSTPAIGVLTEKKCPINLSLYTFAYFGALITIVILIRCVFNCFVCFYN